MTRHQLTTLKRTVRPMVAALAVIGAAAPALAGNLVLNGGFESNGGNGQLGYNTSAADWSVPAPPGSYAFLYAPGTGDTTGANGQYGNVAIWGPNNGSSNGLPATSPAGGYYVAADPAFQQGAISQTISGLTPDATYTLGFWWAAAQQYGFTGETSQQWEVSLGSQTLSTANYPLPSQGFSGWMYQTFKYTATGPSEVLSFFANGSPQVPPFALLDGVSLTASVPEASTWAMMLIGFAGLGLFGVRSARRKAAATA